MPDSLEFSFFDLRAGQRDATPQALFSEWREGNERVVIVSPRPADALLGAGYLMLALQAAKVPVYVMVCCDARSTSAGDAARDETAAAYRAIGLSEDRVASLGVPDLSLEAWRGWMLPGGPQGILPRMLKALRAIRATRLVVPNGYREHPDLVAGHLAACEAGPVVGDAVLPDWGQAKPIRSYLQYAVWSDFAPEDAIVAGADPRWLRGNCAILTGREAEDRVVDALNCFRSQEKVLDTLMSQRRGRFHEGHAIEVYLSFDPRPPLRYQPYHARVREMGA
jgi:LmbE family N-acetylglucosaminyl deacetylase